MPTTARKDADIVSREVRSRMMRAVGQRDTGPEIAVRRILRNLGIGYRVRNRDLPGSPDIANRKRCWAIFVHGCFWHGHQNCQKTKGGESGRIPKQNRAFWTEKIRANRKRDKRKESELRRAGYRVFVVWECALQNPEAVRRRLARLLAEDDPKE